MAAFLVVAGACSSGDDDGDAGSSSAAAQATQTAPSSATEPVVNRVIITNPSTNVESNNTQRDLNPPAGMQLKPLYESLVGYDPITAALTPQLATSWSIEPDGFSFRFKLQEGVRFHGDNGEFDAKDVVFSHS